jgi:polyhydroxyalkanoate synthesis regulator protein
MLSGKQEIPRVAPILVKRYGRSRLYDTMEGRYVSVDDLRLWRHQGISFRVLDVETGEDVTLVLVA